MNFALVTDCGVSQWETKIQQYLHHMSSDEESPPGYEKTHFREKANHCCFLCKLLSGLIIL